MKKTSLLAVFATLALLASSSAALAYAPSHVNNHSIEQTLTVEKAGFDMNRGHGGHGGGHGGGRGNGGGWGHGGGGCWR